MSIYQDALGAWILFDGTTKHTFSTEAEARIFMAKIDTAKAVINAVKALASTADDAENLKAEFFDAGTFTDADVAPLGITAAQLASCITLLEQFDKLMTNQETDAAMYRVTLNAVRRVAT